VFGHFRPLPKYVVAHQGWSRRCQGLHGWGVIGLTPDAVDVLLGAVIQISRRAFLVVEVRLGGIEVKSRDRGALPDLQRLFPADGPGDPGAVPILDADLLVDQFEIGGHQPPADGPVIFDEKDLGSGLAGLHHGVDLRRVFQGGACCMQWSSTAGQARISSSMRAPFGGKDRV